MKMIKDERLQLQNLKNIRIAYIIQTMGIIGILGYDWVTKGLDEMRANPLWLVFIITTIISAYLSMSISVDNERKNHSPKKSFLISLLVIFLISTAIGIFTWMTDGFTIFSGILIGSVLFICFLIPAYYVYYLRIKRQEDEFDE